ncbi:MAG: MBL fold metallo-hydrolase [Patescibacteria group bacterium]
MKKEKTFLIIIIIFLSIYFIFCYLNYSRDKDLKVYFLDSGQADTILIRSPEKKNILIDVGSEKGVKEIERVIPWWDKKIEIIIITHPHDDHISGIPLLLKKYEIDTIFFTGVFCDSPIYQEVMKSIKEKEINLILPQKEQIIEIEKNCLLYFIYPTENLWNKGAENLNNSSIVNKLVCKNKSFLFTGDIEEDAEKEILKNSFNIKSDVLKVPHHGSISSTHQEFLNEVSPKISIIMVGKNNKHNHPSNRIINRLKKIGSEVFRTDLDGSILIGSDGENLYSEKINQQKVYWPINF